MQKELVDQWADLGKSALDSMKELGDINSKIVDKITQQQQEILDICLEASRKELELVGEGKDPADLFKAQSELAREYNQKFLDIAKETTEVLTQCEDDLSNWAEKGVETASSTFTPDSD